MDPFNAVIQKANEIPFLAVKQAQQRAEEAHEAVEALARQRTAPSQAVQPQAPTPTLKV